jgi:hypothetical protein
MEKEKVLQAYLETALWSSIDDDGTPLDDEFFIGDISIEAVEMARTDVGNFVDMIGDIDEEETQIGHDFWLTRNGHGAGFWDGDYPEATEKILMDAVKNFHEIWVYVGDDNKIYFS